MSWLQPASGRAQLKKGEIKSKAGSDHLSVSGIPLNYVAGSVFLFPLDPSIAPFQKVCSGKVLIGNTFASLSWSRANATNLAKISNLASGQIFTYNICTLKKLTSTENGSILPRVKLSQRSFLDDRQGKKFADVVSDPDSPFKSLIVFFSSPERQRRMEDSEIHHDRAPLAGVVRELEGLPEVESYLALASAQQSMRLRQAIGVLVRMVMESLGWRKTGKKGSLGVRASTSHDAASNGKPEHNTGGLAFWFLRAERYELENGMPYRSVKERCDDFQNWALPNTKDKRDRILK